MERYPLVEAHRQPAARRLGLAWSDGHRAELDYDYLRGWCPCAGCQGHSGLRIVYQPPKRPVDLQRIEPVGNYALSFLWSDGHGTGIYKFDYLRSLCPCPECTAARGGAEPGFEV